MASEIEYDKDLYGCTPAVAGGSRVFARGDALEKDWRKSADWLDQGSFGNRAVALVRDYIRFWAGLYPTPHRHPLAPDDYFCPRRSQWVSSELSQRADRQREHV